MIRLGDADPELLDAFMDSRSRRAQAMSALAAAPTASVPVQKPSGPAGFAADLQAMTKVA